MKIAFHGKWFARAGLAIGKNCAIVPIKHTVDRWNSNFFEDIFLVTLLAEYFVKSETMSRSRLTSFSVKFRL